VPSTVELTQQFDDMPQLEPAEEAGGSQHQLGGDDPSRLIDKLLSKLAPEQLAQVTRVFEAKLKQHGLVPVAEDPQDPLQPPPEPPHQPPVAKEPVEPVSEASPPKKPKETGEVAKKLADYRAKMRQKRESERLAREIDSICHRLDRLHDLDRNPAGGSEPKFLQPLDWQSVGQRLRNSVETKPPGAPVRPVTNLEQEASSESDNDDGESKPGCSGSQKETLSSLKVRIRLAKGNAVLVQKNCNQSSDQNLKPLESSLPLKKRFKCIDETGSGRIS